MFKTLKSGLNGIRFARGIKAMKKADSEEERIRARQYLADLLSEQKGLICKIGQLMSETGNSEDPLQKLCDHVDALPFETIAAHIASSYDEQTLHGLEIEEQPLAAASLSQVHQARTTDGQDLVLKIQYPHIRQHIEADMRLLGLMPGMGPVKKWNIDLEGHRQHLKNILALELNYAHEAQQQVHYKQALDPDEHIIVPDIIAALSNDTIIAQTFERGSPLTACSAWPAAARKHIAQTLIQHFFKQLFIRHQIHGDPHDGNYAFLNQTAGNCVILYDFGCLQNIPAEQAQALLQLIMQAHRRTNADPVTLYSRIGFDADKLKHIADQLPAITDILFAPFMQDDAFQLRDWHPSKAIKQLLGEHAWYFRSAGPTNGLLILRAFSGLFRQIKTLNAYVNWYALLRTACPTAWQAANTYQAPERDAAASSFQTLAQHLSISVKKNGIETVALQLPAQAVEDLPQLIDADIKQRISNSDIHLDQLLQAVRASGYQCQTLFELEAADKTIIVQLH